MFDEPMLIGRFANELLPEELHTILSTSNESQIADIPIKTQIGDSGDVNVRCSRMGHTSSSKGWVVVLTKNESIQ